MRKPYGTEGQWQVRGRECGKLEQPVDMGSRT